MLPRLDIAGLHLSGQPSIFLHSRHQVFLGALDVFCPIPVLDQRLHHGNQIARLAQLPGRFGRTNSLFPCQFINLHKLLQTFAHFGDEPGWVIHSFGRAPTGKPLYLLDAMRQLMQHHGHPLLRGQVFLNLNQCRTAFFLHQPPLGMHTPGHHLDFNLRQRRIGLEQIVVIQNVTHRGGVQLISGELDTHLIPLHHDFAVGARALGECLGVINLEAPAAIHALEPARTLANDLCIQTCAHALDGALQLSGVGGLGPNASKGKQRQPTGGQLPHLVCDHKTWLVGWALAAHLNAQLGQQLVIRITVLGTECRVRQAHPHQLVATELFQHGIDRLGHDLVVEGFHAFPTDLQIQPLEHAPVAVAPTDAPHRDVAIGHQRIFTRQLFRRILIQQLVAVEDRPGTWVAQLTGTRLYFLGHLLADLFGDFIQADFIRVNHALARMVKGHQLVETVVGHLVLDALIALAQVIPRDALVTRDEGHRVVIALDRRLDDVLQGQRQPLVGTGDKWGTGYTSRRIRFSLTGTVPRTLLRIAAGERAIGPFHHPVTVLSTRFGLTLNPNRPFLGKPIDAPPLRPIALNFLNKQHPLAVGTLTISEPDVGHHIFMVSPMG